jgi:sugar phosphate isomerase/epimerase
MLKLLISITCAFVVSSVSPVLAAPPKVKVDHPGLRKLQWQQAAQADSFREMTTFEMIDLLHEMDFHHIELSPGQSLSPEKKTVKTGPDMSAEDLDALLAKLKTVKMDIVSYGPADLSGGEADARRTFEFAKKLKVKTIITDAPAGSLELLDKLATENSINIALTSATPAKRYRDADALLKALEGRSARVGVCADLVAWKQAGQDPVKTVQKLAGHVLLVHLSDIADGKSVPVGTGTVDAAGVLAALKGQQFKGICCVLDDTDNPQDRLENFAKSVNAFNEQVTKLAGTTPDAAH